MKNLILSLLFLLPPLAGAEPQADPSAAAAREFLSTLDEGQEAMASLPFAHEERENFRYTPRDRTGLQMKQMTEPQRAAAMKLLASAMSEKGNLKVTQIMTLETVLAEIEKNPTYRDAGKYTVAVFGRVGDPKGWGWRFEGHHVSVNATLAGGKMLSVTPSFLGSNPGEVRAPGKHLGLRVLAAEQDLAITLVTTLMEAGKKDVIFSEKPPAEILSGENRVATALDPVGIAASDMSESQRKGLMDLISEYVGRYRADIASNDMAKIEKAGIDKIRFGWAGGTKPGEAYYYRIQGPTFLMESANVQNQANHIHATWRDFTGDFGRDLLREHLESDGH